jgi:predicted transcriptional regulator
MTNLIIDLPDELARGLERLAAVQSKSVHQLAVEQLSSLVQDQAAPPKGSPAAVLRAIAGSPHLTAADVDELDAAIAAGRLHVQTRDPFAA